MSPKPVLFSPILARRASPAMSLHNEDVNTIVTKSVKDLILFIDTR